MRLCGCSTIQPWLARLQRQEPIWEYTSSPYMLRHSGPSWDRLKGRRTLAEIQKRGLWASHRSVSRYEQAARIASEYQKIQQAMRLWMEDVTRKLEQYVLEGETVPGVPELAEDGK